MRMRWMLMLVIGSLVASGCVFVERVSLTSAGGQLPEGIGFGRVTDVSEDGRYVVFETDTQMDVNDANGVTDVFVRDTRSGATTRVSVNESGETLNARSYQGRISADGDVVVFETTATNWDEPYIDSPTIAAGEWRNGAAFLQTVHCPLNICGPLDIGRTARRALLPDVDADGSTIVFTSDFPYRVNDDNEVSDVYRVERTTGGVNFSFQLVSQTDDDEIANGTSRNPSINGNGTIVVFQSLATNLVPEGDVNGVSDVFLRSLSGITRKVSQDQNGLATNGASTTPVIDSSGLRIAYTSTANDIVPGDSGTSLDVFRYDLVSDTTIRVGLDDTDARPGNVFAVHAISDGGDRVLFDGVDAVSGDPTFWIRDIAAGRSDVVGQDPLDTMPVPVAASAALSGDGRYAAFVTDVAVLESDTNGQFDVYIQATPDPQIASVTPAASAGATTSVTIAGERLSDVTTVLTQAGASPPIAWSNVVVVDDSTITADVTVAAGVDPGAYLVLARTPDGGPGTNSGAAGICGNCLVVTP